jgi:D-alanyl-D-alanine carboxypeptidase
MLKFESPFKELTQILAGTCIWAAVLLCLFSLVVASPATAKPPGQARIAVDAHTGEVLFAKGSQVRWHPASLTKMMTLYQTFNALERRKISLKTRIAISRRAARQPPSKLGVRVGNRITVRTAIEALAVKSANDIAVALAEHLAGSERNFAKQMNKTARWLGMSKTNFRNASGLHHSQQYTTARDMAILSVAMIRDFPQYYKYFSQNSFRFNGRTYRSHNKILKVYSGADGIKTGYIGASGFNLAASATRGDGRVVAVVLGGASSDHRTVLMKRLLDQGFKQLKAPSRSRIARPLPIKLAPLPPVPRPRSIVRRNRAPRYAPIPRPHPNRSALPATANARPAKQVASGSVRRNTATSAFAVQVGAYRSAGLAQQRLNVVLGALPGAHSPSAPRVIPFKDPRQGLYYRARLTGYKSRAAANATCDWLRSNQNACTVVSEQS